MAEKLIRQRKETGSIRELNVKCLHLLLCHFLRAAYERKGSISEKGKETLLLERVGNLPSRVFPPVHCTNKNSFYVCSFRANLKSNTFFNMEPSRSPLVIFPGCQTLAVEKAVVATGQKQSCSAHWSQGRLPHGHTKKRFSS